ncbi:MarR family winged helix-turn-helix transcriptional regulator [Actinacidiphila yeochonensis]|uniref:MarR family winged helix-turn-helix transcriptional regulator n=1 Tax=Actinacidiphila yeochonensis TaxID=89050 RepID=UPI00056A4A29|nr:MarR family transcriptional regulator [Actinacidiphila yeochonensis]
MSERQVEPSEGAASGLAVELRAALGQLVRRLREQTDRDDLTKSQTSVLLRLEREGPATAAELAVVQGVRPQSMAKIVRALEDAGLVVGEPDPADGRRTRLSLSDAAREQFRTGRRAKQDWLTRAVEDTLTPEEIEQLSGAVHLLRRLAQSP